MEVDLEDPNKCKLCHDGYSLTPQNLCQPGLCDFGCKFCHQANLGCIVCDQDYLPITSWKGNKKCGHPIRFPASAKTKIDNCKYHHIDRSLGCYQCRHTWVVSQNSQKCLQQKTPQLFGCRIFSSDQKSCQECMPGYEQIDLLKNANCQILPEPIFPNQNFFEQNIDLSLKCARVDSEGKCERCYSEQELNPDTKTCSKDQIGMELCLESEAINGSFPQKCKYCKPDV